MVSATSLLDRRFVIISGKGGVGRTTVAAALAQATTQKRRQVLLTQIQSPERLGRLLNSPSPIPSKVTSIGPDLNTVNMTPKNALRQYGLMVLRYERLYRALFD